MAGAIIKGLTLLDTSHLNKVYEELMKNIEINNSMSNETLIPKEIISEILNLDIESLESLYNDVIELSFSNWQIDYYDKDLKHAYQQAILDKMKYLTPEQIVEIKSRIFNNQYTHFHNRRK